MGRPKGLKNRRPWPAESRQLLSEMKTGLALTQDPKYGAVHYRARRALEERPCAHQDESCSRLMTAALRHDAEGPIRTQGGTEYSLKETDYIRLCKSHHTRYDNTGWLYKQQQRRG